MYVANLKERSFLIEVQKLRIYAMSAPRNDGYYLGEANQAL